MALPAVPRSVPPGRAGRDGRAPFCRAAGDRQRPGLKLLRELLSEDGSIWVTIDDNEGHYFKVLMDEVFGRGNFVATAIWQKLHARNNSAQHLSADHEPQCRRHRCASLAPVGRRS
ncbi:MAG: site-specific DNA-methyltransferase [Methylibium sp.]|nr:site-specific DNA-methyltransferase [Methylibium sp.]